VAETETSLRQAELNFAALQLRGDITKALLETALADEILKIGTQDLAWLETVAETAENKYRSGATSIADTLQAQNEVAMRADSLRTDQHRLEHGRISLNRFLNRDAGAPWPSLRLPEIAPSIPLSQKLLNLSLANEPKLKIIEQEIKQAAASTQLTRNMRLPDVSLGIEGRQFSGDGEFRSGMFTLRFSLPWFNSGKYRKEYQRDSERRQAAIQDHEDRALLVREELHHLAVEMDAARRQAVLQSGDIALRAQQALNSRLADWQTGRGNLRDVLDARRTVLESRLLAARATAEEHGILAEMLVWSGLETLEALELLANEPPLLSDHQEVHEHQR
jgi:outer membrane protein TolC